jgi:hypothetical protein
MSQCQFPVFCCFVFQKSYTGNIFGIGRNKFQKSYFSQKLPRSTRIKAWGCPRGTPSLSAKIRSPFKTLYFYCFMHYAFFLERQLFLLLVFFCLVCCNKRFDHIIFLLEEMNSLFICQEHSSFHSYRSMSVLFFYYCV